MSVSDRVCVRERQRERVLYCRLLCIFVHWPVERISVKTPALAWLPLGATGRSKERRCTGDMEEEGVSAERSRGVHFRVICTGLLNQPSFLKF